MADLHTYRVLRQMDGDKQYFSGDTREMMAADAQPLVALGVLQKIEKSEAAPRNKAEPAPRNKAAKA